MKLTVGNADLAAKLTGYIVSRAQLCMMLILIQPKLMSLVGVSTLNVCCNFFTMTILECMSTASVH